MATSKHNQAPVAPWHRRQACRTNHLADKLASLFLVWVFRAIAPISIRSDAGENIPVLQTRVRYKSIPPSSASAIRWKQASLRLQRDNPELLSQA
jgi:hypothetical protein